MENTFVRTLVSHCMLFVCILFLAGCMAHGTDEEELKLAQVKAEEIEPITRLAFVPDDERMKKEPTVDIAYDDKSSAAVETAAGEESNKAQGKAY